MGIVALLVLLFLRVPVGLAMIIVALTGNIILSAPGPALSKLGIDAILVTQNYGLSVIPLFVLMGMFLTKADLGGALFDVINYFVGRRKGGMAVGTIAASTAFGTVCGSVVASVSTLAAVAVPEMEKHKYNRGFAAGVTSIGSALGVVIPPSSALVIYGILTEESIGQVLIAGIMPGIFTMILLMLTVPLVLKWKPELAPEAIKERGPFPKESVKLVWAVPVIFIVCIGGIYGGFFTPTEAGSIGAFLSLIFSLAVRKMSWKNLLHSFEGAVRISAMTFMLLLGGQLFGQFLTRSLIPMALIKFIQNMAAPPFLIIIVILLIYTAMGPLMDEMSTLVIMTPILYPIVISLGYNGVWFGVMTTMMLISGLLMPPVGVVSLVAASITKIPSREVFRYQWPFWVTLVISCVCMVAFPNIVMFLPNLMFGK
jgi:tripartite ATP-independent transporter DctM subunit